MKINKTVTYSIIKKGKYIIYELRYSPFKGLNLGIDRLYKGFDNELDKYMKHIKDPYILILTLLDVGKTKKWIIDNYEKLILDGSNKYRLSNKHAEFREKNYNDLILKEGLIN